jgi:site-specific DNA recombinase
MRHESARRVLGYARVSSEEQARGTSLTDQQAAISAYARSRGLEVTRFFVEAESAIHEKIERREQIRALMSDVRGGDLVLCDKLDRWSRDPEFTYGSVRTILERGASFFAVGDQCDPSTQEGDTTLGFRILFAREEHKRIKLRLVGTRKLLRDRGYYSEGLPPLGYARPHPSGSRGVGLAKNVLQIVEPDAEMVRSMFRRIVAGESAREIADSIRTSTPRHKLDHSRVCDCLRNRIYLGEVKDTSGAWIKGRHEAIVDPDLFARAQKALDAHRKGGPKLKSGSRTAGWIAREIGVCGKCGKRISAAYGGWPKHVTDYYRCPDRSGCRARHVRVSDVDPVVCDAVLDRLVELRAQIATGTWSRERPATPTVDVPSARLKLASKRERLLDLAVDGTLTREDLRSRLAKLDAERDRLDAIEREQTRVDPLEDPTIRRTVLGQITELRRAWTAATPVQRRQILRLLATAVRLERGVTPVIEWRSPEELAADVRA